jgi:hypothetical protein
MIVHLRKNDRSGFSPNSAAGSYPSSAAHRDSRGHVSIHARREGRAPLCGGAPPGRQGTRLHAAIWLFNRGKFATLGAFLERLDPFLMA